MADQNPQHITPPDPLLLAPLNEAVLDGHTVAFSWEPVDHALEYLLQVSPDSTFDRILLEETLPAGGTSLTVDNRFATDDETLYWRVMARNDAGWSPGDRVESFVSGTAGQAALHLSRPDDDEHYGPYPQLVKSGAVGVAAEVTGDNKYFAEEEREGVQHEGVETGQIMGIVVAVLLALVLMIITMILLVDNLALTTRRQFTGISGYPELTRVTEEAQAKLTEYGIIDEEAGVYQIPIDSAMRLMVLESRGSASGPFSSELPLIPESLQPAPPESGTLPGGPPSSDPAAPAGGQ